MYNVYDNGEKILGKVIDIKRYINANKQHWEETDAKEIMDELKDMEYDTIVALDYNHGMGWYMDWWDYKDIVQNNYTMTEDELASDLYGVDNNDAECHIEGGE